MNHFIKLNYVFIKLLVLKNIFYYIIIFYIIIIVLYLTFKFPYFDLLVLIK